MSRSVSQILPQAEHISALPFTVADSISNAVALGEPDIKKYCATLNGQETEIIIKHKSAKILLGGIAMLSKNDPKLLLKLTSHHYIFGYDHSYRREIKIYQNFPSDLQEYLLPFHNAKRFGTDYYLTLGFIQPTHTDLHKNDYPQILDALINIQTKYYNDPTCIKTFQLNHFTPQVYRASKSTLQYIWQKLDNSEYFTASQIAKLTQFIQNCDKFRAKYSEHNTLSHNDFSYRNIFIKDQQTYFYDWELAAYQNPEHDVLEFLIYHAELYNDTEIKDIFKYYYSKIKSQLNLTFTKVELQEILQFNLCELIINRLSLLRLASQQLKLSMVDQLLTNAKHLLTLIGEPNL